MSGCPGERRTSPFTMRSTRRSVAGLGERGRGGGRADAARRTSEGQLHVGVARDFPPELVNGPVVLVAQLDQVVEIGRPTIDPVSDVVQVRELDMGASGEPAA